MLEYLKDDIQKMAKEGLSAGTMADRFAVKGIVVCPREINKFILKQKLFRPKKIIKAKRQIKLTEGKGSFNVKQIYPV